MPIRSTPTSTPYTICTSLTSRLIRQPEQLPAHEIIRRGAAHDAAEDVHGQEDDLHGFLDAHAHG